MMMMIDFFCPCATSFFFRLTQTNQSFEAQEVSSPTNVVVQPQWRQKVMQWLVMQLNFTINF